MAASSPNCPTAPASSAGWQPKPAGSDTSWPNLLSWGWPTATALNCAIPYARAGGSVKSGRRASPTIVGSWGGKLCIVQNQWGLITDWDCATANVPDQTFLPLLAHYDGQMIILTDAGFHRAKGDPANVKVCQRGQWNARMTVETTFSMLTQVWGSKEMRHLTWAGFEAHLCYTVAAFNILVQWDGLQPDENGRLHRSIAHFTL